MEPLWIELRAVAFFRRLADEEVEVLGELLHPMQFAPGEIIHQSGTRLDTLYVLLEGAVALTSGSGPGAYRIVDILAPKECFPVEVFLHSRQSPLQAVALSPVKCLAIDIHGLTYIMEKDPFTGRELYSAAAESLGAMLGRVLKGTAQPRWDRLL